MKAFAKILAVLILVVFVALVALGFAITYLFDPNDYKDRIRELARDKAHIELKLDGDIGWSLFPWLGLELRDTRIASLQHPDEPIADVTLLGLSVKALPLLRKEVQMSDIRVQGLTLHLKRDEQGHGNWQSLGKAPKVETPQKPRATEASDTAVASAPTKRALSLDIDSLRVTDARVIYQDARSGKTLTAEGIDLSTGAIAENRSIPIKLEVFIGTNQPVVRTRNLLSANLTFDRAQGRYVLENVALTGAASGEPLAGKTLNYSAHSHVLYDQSAGVAEFNQVKINANELEALGELKLYNLDQTPHFSGALSVAQINLRHFLEELGQTLPAMADSKTLQSVEFNSLLEGTSQQLTLKELALSLDQSHITGTVSLNDLAKGSWTAQLAVDQLNLDRYLSPETAEQTLRQAEVKEAVNASGSQGTTATPSAPTTNAWSTHALINAKTFNALDVTLALTAKELTVKSLPLENLVLKAKAQKGQNSLEQLDARIKGGQIALSGQLDTRNTPFAWHMMPEVQKVPLELFFKKNQAPVTGLLQLSAKLNSQGNSEQELINALSGKASFALLDGVLVDANLEQPLCRAIATLNRKTPTHLPNGKDTPFNTLKGTLTLRNGIATNPDLLTRVPGLTLKGNGDVDLRVLGMDYRVGIIVEGDQRAMPDEACQVNQRYVGIEWPLHCRGPIELGAKACRMDSQGLTQVAAKLATNKLSEKIEEKLGDKASPELKDALKKLFNR